MSGGVDLTTARARPLAAGRSLAHALFDPRSVVVVGASDDPRKLSGRVLSHLLTEGYRGTVHVVNPRRAEVQGVATHASIAALPPGVEVAIIALPAAAVADALRECAAAGIATAIVFASGFAETGAEGALLQHELAAIRDETGVRVLGPNCIGTIGLRSGFTGTFSALLGERPLQPGPFAFVTQSGAFGTLIFSAAQASGIGVSHFANTGNELDVGVAELALALLEDDEVQALGLYMEGLTDGAGLIEVARRASALDKPVVCVKAGRSAAGARAAASHTGSLAGEDRVFDAVARQHGLLRVDGMEPLLDAARVLSSGRRARGRRVTIVTVSGGAGILMADAAAERGLEVPTWTAAWRERFDGIVPPYGSTVNPIDVTATLTTQPGTLEATIGVVAAHPETDAIAVMLGSGAQTEQQLVAAVVAAYGQTDKPLVVAWAGESPSPLVALGRAGVPVFTDPSRAIAALDLLVRWSLRSPPPSAAPAFAERASGADAARALCAQARAAGRRQLDEHESKQLLAAYGLACVEELPAAALADAAAAADELGYPVALKLLSTEVAHKSDLGGVRLGLADAAAVRAAATEVLALARERGLADARLLVQRMAQPGAELILGATDDPAFGPVVAAGLGGVLAELLDDVALARAPLDREQALRLLANLRGGRVLDGLRGAPAADREAVAEAIVRLAALAEDLRGELAEVDINPLIAGPSGAVAVDALVVLAPTPAEREEEAR